MARSLTLLSYLTTVLRALCAARVQANIAPSSASPWPIIGGGTSLALSSLVESSGSRSL